MQQFVKPIVVSYFLVLCLLAYFMPICMFVGMALVPIFSWILWRFRKWDNDTKEEIRQDICEIIPQIQATNNECQRFALIFGPNYTCTNCGGKHSPGNFTASQQ